MYWLRVVYCALRPVLCAAYSWPSQVDELLLQSPPAHLFERKVRPFPSQQLFSISLSMECQCRSLPSFSPPFGVLVLMNQLLFIGGGGGGREGGPVVSYIRVCVREFSLPIPQRKLTAQ
jgi:hypothetical protein